jgi:hypothetical protein
MRYLAIAALFGGLVAAGALQGQEVRFATTPRAKRIQPVPGLETYGDAAVQAIVVVTGDGGTPVVDTDVILRARSEAGPFKTETGRTDKSGRASVRLVFDFSLGSLSLAVQACLKDRSDVCTEVERLSLRNWVDFDLGFDLSYLAVPDPAAGQEGVTIYSDNVFSSVIWPRLQVTLWETQRKWRYYGVSVYGTVPGLFQDRSVLIPTSVGPATLTSVDRKAGLGDFATGVSVNLRGNLAADVSYNGRSGKLNLVDSVRTLGQPRAVNLGDGFESIDASAQLNHVIGSRGPLVFASGATSRAFPRVYSNGDRAERGDFYQTTGGIGFIRKSRSSVVLFWGAHASYQAVRLVASGKPSVVSPSRGDWMVGVTRSGTRRGRASVTAGAFAGGLGSDQIYLGLNLRLDFRLF